MITGERPAPNADRDWQAALREAITDPAELIARLDLPPAWRDEIRAASGDFALRVPRSYVARMRPGDPNDPLLRQVLPRPEEMRAVPGYSLDPLAEWSDASDPGVLRKYAGRALLVTTGACAVHCRYCFRRHFPYGAASGTAPDRVDPEGRESIEEVILSGGDPWMLSNARLHRLTDALRRDLPGLRRLRVHTRQPIVLPERVDAGLLEWVAAWGGALVIVVHANHPQEIDASVRAGLTDLRARGAHLLNQGVLLRGVNDGLEALMGLSEALFSAGVLPYYLHQLDPVAGAAHFAVPDAEAIALVQALRDRLPGYLVPRLVREEAGASSKTPLA